MTVYIRWIYLLCLRFSDSVYVCWSDDCSGTQMSVLARQCVDEEPILRPDMKQVVISLSQILLSSIEWEATLAGNSQVFSELVQGRWCLPDLSFRLFACPPFPLYSLYSDASNGNSLFLLFRLFIIQLSPLFFFSTISSVKWVSLLQIPLGVVGDFFFSTWLANVKPVFNRWMYSNISS